MALEDRFNFEDLVNESERAVFDELERQLGAGVATTTEDAVLDMAAYALNHVPARYRVNLLGRLYARGNDEAFGASVSRAVREAISKVRSEEQR
ncbi:MAG: late competence development ComFB family protein [Spirochaetales bacterium]